MATSLAVIIILGLGINYVFIKLRLPGLIGMLILGIITGPYVLDILDQRLLDVSSDLRQIALVIILLRAGLTIDMKTLKKVSYTSLTLGFIPVLIEGFTIAFISIYILDFTFLQGGILGFIIAAVSPAVVVPLMLDFKSKSFGEKKEIPTLILAGASLDDVFAITIFSTFIGIYSGNTVSLGYTVFSIPLSIILGIFLGLILGILFVKFFTIHHLRDTKKVLLILGASLLLNALESELKSLVQIASLLGVMTIGFVILEKKNEVAKRLAKKFSKIWILAELLLFVLVGAQVNIQVALDSGKKGLLIILIGIIGRMIGVLIATIKSNLNKNEKLFVAVSYIPKATVQAAVGAIPLSLGIKGGEIILAISVLSILTTAPIGAILINKLKFLIKDS